MNINQHEWEKVIRELRQGTRIKGGWGRVDYCDLNALLHGGIAAGHRPALRAGVVKNFLSTIN
jgi:hypothetical protein